MPDIDTALILLATMFAAVLAGVALALLLFLVFIAPTI